MRFAPSPPQWTDAGVAVKVAITEGAVYQLGTVELIGEDLPREAMLAAGRLQPGKTANWKQIQTGIWESEKVVKRMGFLDATALPNRLLDDAARLLHLRITINKGALYRLGEVHFTGLSANLQEQARRVWKPKSGAPYDYGYPGEFLHQWSSVIDFHAFRKYDVVTKKGTGDHVIDVQLVFEPK